MLCFSFWAYSSLHPYLLVLGSLANVPSFRNTVQLDDLIFQLSLFAVSIAITFTGTSLIILHILLVTRSSPLTVHTPTYRRIQRILIESGILYTIAMFIAGVTLAIQVAAHARASIPLADPAIYMEAILIPMSVSLLSSSATE